MVKKLIKPTLITLALVAFYAVSGFFILPALLKMQLPGLIHDATGRHASVEKIAFNPFDFCLEIQGFTLQETDGQAFVAFDRLYTDLAVFTSIRHIGLVIDTFQLDKPFLRVAKNQKGIFNFDDLGSDTQEEKDASEGLFPVKIHQLNLSAGSALWEHARANGVEKETLQPINLKLLELSTFQDNPANLELNMAFSSGATLQWSGEASLNPIHSKGLIKLEKADLFRIATLFLQDLPGVMLEKGQLAVSAAYLLNYDNRVLQLDAPETKIDLESFKLTVNDQGGGQTRILNDKMNLQAGLVLRSEEKGLSLQSKNTRLEMDNMDVSGKDMPLIKVKHLDWNTHLAVEQSADQLKLSAGQNQINLAEVGLFHHDGLKHFPAITIRSLKSQSEFAFDDANQVLNYSISAGTADLKSLVITDPGQNSKVVTVPTLAVQGITVEGGKQRVKLAKIDTANATLNTWLNEDGTFNLQNLFVVKGTDKETSRIAESGNSSQPAWQIAVDDLVINDYQVSFADRNQNKPLAVELSDLNLQVKGFDTLKTTALPIDFKAQINKSGKVSIAGDAVLDPFSADFSVALDNLHLKGFQPYLEQFAKLDIIDGGLSTDGSLSLALTPSGELDLKYNGNANVDSLLLRDQKQHRDFVKWENLHLTKINVDLLKQHYFLKDVLFDRPYIRLLIKKEGGTNFDDVIADNTDASSAAPSSEKMKAKPKNSPVFKIGAIQLKDGMSDFADYSLILPFVTKMTRLNGNLQGLSSDKGATAKLNLDGKVYDLAKVDIDGQYALDSGDSAVELKFEDMPLPLVTPYMAEFAGYKIEKGQMSLDLKYTIKDNKLVAENKLFIDQFTLGEKVDNPKAVSLPLELAITLMKDGDGKINLELPISGSLDDPQFSVSSLVFKALGNVIGKIASAPFKMLASLVNFGSDEDLSMIGFSEGNPDLPDHEKMKLDAIAKALISKPTLSLEVKGAAFQDLDWPAMRDEALKDQLKKIKAKELRTKGERTRSEYIELSEDEYKRLLAQQFIEKFPSLADVSIFGTPRLKEGESGDFYEVARQKLEALLPPEEQRLNDLAVLRAGNVAKYLQEAGIASNRVFLLATELDPERSEPGVNVKLSIR
ncbi:DUF748 domain-containing protein [Methylicorpusculum oleiharenae]|uniref:DUF748 domain-containing protein n=1 Tax=Methylicorpusculum oleiharenae TaxID=1338687 RepID=UPI0013576966|nr:DUF748 domain-containing protein [Methylicorpusculum oleiharenae]MCD2452636.1 DUF748 domain-containing protein [Methylicorpusculum oleiharenae]